MGCTPSKGEAFSSSFQNLSEREGDERPLNSPLQRRPPPGPKPPKTAFANSPVTRPAPTPPPGHSPSSRRRSGMAAPAPAAKRPLQLSSGASGRSDLARLSSGASSDGKPQEVLRLPPSTKYTTSCQRVKQEDGVKWVNGYRLGVKLGKGSYAKVKLCEDSKDGDRPYAVKIFSRQRLLHMRTGAGAGKLGSGRTAMDDVLREISIMANLDSPRCVTLVEVIDDPAEDKLFVVMEYVSGGSLMSGTVDSEPIAEGEARELFDDLMAGVTYLHGAGFVHRDIKPENLLKLGEGDGERLPLVSAAQRVKLADFGTSTQFERGRLPDWAQAAEFEGLGLGDDAVHNTVGTPAFHAPECCQPGPYSARAADVWACGISLYQLLFGKVPFIADNMMDMYVRVVNDEPDYTVKGIALSDATLEVLRGLLAKDVGERMRYFEKLCGEREAI